MPLPQRSKVWDVLELHGVTFGFTGIDFCAGLGGNQQILGCSSLQASAVSDTGIDSEDRRAHMEQVGALKLRMKSLARPNKAPHNPYTVSTLLFSQAW